MKKGILTAVLLCVIPLAACGRSTISHAIPFPAYTVENPQNLPHIAAVNNTSPFTVTVDLPKAWSIRETADGALMPLGEFYTPLYLYNGDKPIGYIGFDCFTPLPDAEVPQEDYYKTVYPTLRLSSLFHWDPYTPVLTTETGETGLAEIWYKDPAALVQSADQSMASLPELESIGILSYDKELGVYIGIAFCPGTVDQAQAETIATSIRLTTTE